MGVRLPAQEDLVSGAVPQANRVTGNLEGSSREDAVEGVIRDDLVNPVFVGEKAPGSSRVGIYSWHQFRSW